MWRRIWDTAMIFNHQFWKDFRKAVKAANPNAIILAEHYGNPEGWLKVMNGIQS